MTTDMTKEEIELLTNVVPAVELPKPTKEELLKLDRWQAMVGKWFWKWDAVKKEVQKGLYFEPTNVFPAHAPLDKPDSDGKPKYRFNVRAHFGAVLDSDRQPKRDRLGDVIVRVAPDPRTGMGYDQMIDCIQFEQDYKPAS